MGLARFRFEYSNHQYFNNVYFFFQSLEDYIERIEKVIEEEIGQAKNKLQQFEEEIGDNPTWADEVFTFEDALRQKSLLRVIYYDSLVLSIYSFIEKQMLFVCHKLEADQIIKVKDINGKGVFKYRTYLEKVIGADFSEVQEEWEILMSFNKIRNFLVHDDGFRIFPKTNTELKSCLSHFAPDIQLTDHGDQIGFMFTGSKFLKDFCAVGAMLVDHFYTEKV
jgi:hypothetical protein